MLIRWREHSDKDVTDGRTDGRTDRNVLRAAWSQLKKQGKNVSSAPNTGRNSGKLRKEKKRPKDTIREAETTEGDVRNQIKELDQKNGNGGKSRSKNHNREHENKTRRQRKNKQKELHPRRRQHHQNGRDYSSSTRTDYEWSNTSQTGGRSNM